MDENLNNLLETVKKHNPNADLELIKKAYETAKEAHKDQVRYSGEPYITHPYNVAIILAELEMDSKSIAAGLLHDVIEDTKTTLEDIKKQFGDEVALLVEGVTKLEKIPYTSKEEQQIENLRKMFLAMAKDIRVIIIKLADRLHNMRTLKSMREDKQREKAKETLDVYAPLAHRLGISKIKWELEDLSLRYLDPVAYYEIVESINQKKTERDRYIKAVMDNLSEKISSMGYKFHIEGRAKHFYSIFRKMYGQNKSIDEIYDLFAVRVIVDTITECYAILGLVHETYKPIPGRFKDYIAMPKPNMYQSLHTTVIGPNGTPCEIQIRTWEMHKTAEYGIAAHWKYKEGIKGETQFDEKLQWVRNMLDVQSELSDTEDFMKTLKIDLFADEIFVFTPKGDVINLPTGSCAIDLAYAIHSEVGNKMVGVKINGKIATIDQELKTGDIVQILTTPASRGPSLDWLKLVKTSQAKSKINQWHKTHNREQHIIKGKELIDRELRKADIANMNEFKDSFAEGIMKKFSIRTIDDMYATVGFEGTLSGKILLRLKDELKKMAAPEEKEQLPELKKKKEQSNNGIIVKGIDNCLVRLSKCCNPVPGDDIIGYITRGRGVSVHRSDCPNVINASEEDKNRMVEVKWDINGDDGSFVAALQIFAVNRVNLVFEISADLANLKVQLVGLNARVVKDNVEVVELALEVKDGRQLETIIKKLKNISGVYEVKRYNN